HCVVPNSTVVAHNHLAHHDGGFCEKAGWAKARCESPYGTDQCHIVLFICQSSTSRNFYCLSTQRVKVPDKMSRRNTKSLYFCVPEVCFYGGFAGRYRIIRKSGHGCGARDYAGKPYRKAAEAIHRELRLSDELLRQ